MTFLLSYLRGVLNVVKMTDMYRIRAHGLDMYGNNKSKIIDNVKKELKNYGNPKNSLLRSFL